MRTATCENAALTIPVSPSAIATYTGGSSTFLFNTGKKLVDTNRKENPNQNAPIMNPSGPKFIHPSDNTLGGRPDRITGCPKISALTRLPSETSGFSGQNWRGTGAVSHDR